MFFNLADERISRLLKKHTDATQCFFGFRLSFPVVSNPSLFPLLLFWTALHQTLLSSPYVCCSHLPSTQISPSKPSSPILIPGSLSSSPHNPPCSPSVTSTSIHRQSGEWWWWGGAWGGIPSLQTASLSSAEETGECWRQGDRILFIHTEWNRWLR